jgi:hypothetical protein
MPVQLIPSFNAGELSPRLESRPDLEKYASACRTLENFVIMPYGGVNRRPGFEYIGAARYADKRCRLIGFNFSVTTNFILEFGDLYVRFWSNGVQVESSPGVPYTVASPYLEAQINDLQYVQINDVMYLAHPNRPVYKLSRLSDTNWTLAEVAWAYPAFRDENTTATTITTEAPGMLPPPFVPAGGAIELLASAPVFAPENVGGYYQVVQKRTNAYVERDISSTGTSNSLRVVGPWDFRTYGTWTATLNIQRRYGSGPWETIRSFRGTNDRNISTSGDEATECELRINITAWSSGASTTRAYIEAQDSGVYGVVKVTGYTSPTLVTGTAVNEIWNVTTEFWSEGSWSPRRGFPRTVAMHEQRLFFGGNTAEPQTIWGSKINDFETFRAGTYDDSALAFTIASSESNAINWMVSQQVLCVGTAGYEYIVSASSSDAAITPSSIHIRPQSHFGSKYSRALLANEVTLFIQRQGRKVREFVFQFEKDGYVSADLTLLADHVTSGGITDIAFQAQPDAILWVVTGDGNLAGMTYERGQNVVGWHRHTTDGVFESVATIYGEGTGGDEVWCSILRVINGVPVRFIERMDPAYRETLEAETKTDWFYVDAGKTYSGAPTVTVTGLSHLNGKTVSILADGAVVPNQTVTGGQVTLPRAASVVTVGLPYTSTLKPMPLDPGQLPDGSAQGRKFRVNRMVVRIYKSLGGEVEVENGEWDPIYSRDTADPMGSSPPVFTGDKTVMVARPYEDKGTIQVRQTQPLPLTVLALIPIYDVLGN